VQTAEASKFAEVAFSSTARFVSICQGIGGGGQLKALRGKQGKAGHEIKDLRNQFERYLFCCLFACSKALNERVIRSADSKKI
jgi:hypothetical protein